MLNIVIFGAPGSGKGTQSEKLVQKYNLAHISTGDVLRAERDSGSELGKHVESYMSKGHLIPDELMIDILAKVFDERCEKGDCLGVIFDGFPRTLPQGKALNETLEKRGEKIEAVVSLDVPEEELLKRLINRGHQTGRSDDNHEIIKERLHVYNNQTEPLKEFYKKENKLYHVEGLDSVEKVFEKIVAIIEKVK